MMVYAPRLRRPRNSSLRRPLPTSRSPNRRAASARWIVYVKGRGAPLRESRVREAMLRCGFIDTKVAAVSND
jgi:hypothetical protein